MEPPPTRECRDCGGKAHEIKILDQAHGTAVDRISYALPEARRSFWSGQFPTEGRVVAYLCDRCGRIAHYGVPKDS